MPKKRNKSDSSNFYSWFFDSSGQQRKWFVIFGVLLPLILSVLFSVWGTWISIKSYNLSVESSNNREQIDTMRVIVDNLRQQNELLIDQNKMIFTQVNQLRKIVVLNENSNEIQTQHFSTVRETVNDAKIPKLSIEKVEHELGSSNQSEFAQYYYLKMVNYGGDIYNIRHKELDTIGSSPINLPVSSMPRSSDMELTFLNPFLYTHKTKAKLRFFFEDALHNKYYQDLMLTKNEGEVLFQMGKMLTSGK